MDIGPPELMILLVVLLVVFGGSQLPKLAKNIGSAQKEFKKAMADAQGGADEASAPSTVTAASADQPAG